MKLILIKQKTVFALFILIFLSCQSCLTRAPTTYELDMRSGTRPATQNYKEKDLNEIKIVDSNTKKDFFEPKKSPPKIEKIWMTSKQLKDNTFMEGTWIWIETQKSRWN